MAGQKDDGGIRHAYDRCMNRWMIDEQMDDGRWTEIWIINIG